MALEKTLSAITDDPPAVETPVKGAGEVLPAPAAGDKTSAASAASIAATLVGVGGSQGEWRKRDADDRRDMGIGNFHIF